MRRLAVILTGLIVSGWSASAQDIPPSAPNTPMVFSSAWSGGNCPRCVWISAEGAIAENTPEAFLAEYYRERPERSGGIVTLNSGGGNLIAALRLGLMWRELGISTQVARTVSYNEPGGRIPRQATEFGRCASACALAFLGGVSRRVENGSLLGVHQFSSSRAIDVLQSQTVLGVTQLTVGALLEYLDELDVSADLLRIASQTPPNSMYWLSAQELNKFGIETFRPAHAHWEGRLLPTGGLKLMIEQRQLESNLSVQASLTCEAQNDQFVTIETVASVVDFSVIRDAILDEPTIRSYPEDTAMLTTGRIDEYFSLSRRTPIYFGSVTLDEGGNMIFSGKVELEAFIDVLRVQESFDVAFGLSSAESGYFQRNGASSYSFPTEGLEEWLSLLTSHCS